MYKEHLTQIFVNLDFEKNSESGYIITKILKWNFHPNANTELITLSTALSGMFQHCL